MPKPLLLPIGSFVHGKTNSLCDVAGVKVGMTTHLGGRGVCTGVTAILPSSRIFAECFAAGSFVLNGAGEMTGLHQLDEWGKLETPILLTNTHGVGIAYSACTEWLMRKYPKIGTTWPVCIPVVGECDDSTFHNIRKRVISSHDVRRALQNASSSFEQGSVGGGTGLTSCGFKAGTGSSSRVLEINNKHYTLGVLLQSNWGKSTDLRVFGKSLAEWGLRAEDQEPSQEGSLVCVVATDAPLDSKQLSRLARRASLGIARAGNTARHGSGEFFVAFSTTNKWKRSSNRQHPFSLLSTESTIEDAQLNVFFEAVGATAEEAFYWSLFKSNPRHDRFGKLRPALGYDLKRSALVVK